MKAERDAYANGLVLLSQKQREVERPVRDPAKARHIAHRIVKDAGLRHTRNERYFSLLATCALMGKEPMYSNFKSKTHHRRTK